MQIQQTPNTLSFDNTTERPKATLEDISLLVGHWRGEFLGALAEEVWLPPAGGSMLGVFRLYKDDRVLFYEIMIAVEEEKVFLSNSSTFTLTLWAGKRKTRW